MFFVWDLWWSSFPSSLTIKLASLVSYFVSTSIGGHLIYGIICLKKIIIWNYVQIILRCASISRLYPCQSLFATRQFHTPCILSYVQHQNIWKCVFETKYKKLQNQTKNLTIGLWDDWNLEVSVGNLLPLLALAHTLRSMWGQCEVSMRSISILISGQYEVNVTSIWSDARDGKSNKCFSSESEFCNSHLIWSELCYSDLIWSKEPWELVGREEEQSLARNVAWKLFWSS